MYTDRQLLDMAKNAMKYSYSPYSHFAVGACVLMKDGSVFTGCNIENSSLGASNCAERTAIFKAVSEGQWFNLWKENFSLGYMQTGH